MVFFAPLHPYLLAQLRTGQGTHAYIFSGDQSFDQALSLAAALFCPQPSAGEACGHCPVCANVNSRTYPDLRFQHPVREAHRVENMRELVAWAGLSPIAGQRKLCIMPQAEKISDDGANTLLKLLEEPSADTTLILLSDQPDALLPTVLSRCQLFLFGQDSSRGEPELPPEMAEAARAWLLSLPTLPVYQVLLDARQYEKDRESQRLYFFALLRALMAAARGESQLPMAPAQLLRSASMVESAVEMMGKSINQKLLTDVVYLRLWQNSR